MFWLRLIYSRLYGLLRKNRIEQEMDDEMRFHLLMRTRDNIERGMRPDEAEREARRRFGNVGRIKDLARDIKGGGFMETLLQDLRYGLRIMLKRPGFILVAIGMLAVGIAANTTIFSITDALIFRPFDFPNQDRLVMIWSQSKSAGYHHKYTLSALFTDWQEQSHSFEQLVRYGGGLTYLSNSQYEESFSV